MRVRRRKKEFSKQDRNVFGDFSRTLALLPSFLNRDTRWLAVRNVSQRFHLVLPSLSPGKHWVSHCESVSVDTLKEFQVEVHGPLWRSADDFGT